MTVAVAPTLVGERDTTGYRVAVWEWPSPALGRPKRVTVLAPVGAGTLAVDPPVLYLLHGFGGSASTWLTGTRLLEHLDGTGLLVVLPESGRRWFINDHRGVRYEDYLVDEVLPFVGSTYGGSRRRAIGGFSMGGAAALMQALRHPGLFPVVVSHAGAFEASRRVGDPYAHLRDGRDFAIPSVEAHERVWGPPGSAVRERYDLHALAGRVTGPPPAVYADVGTSDHSRILGMNRRMIETLERAGVTAEYHERRGGHDLAYLDEALPSSLQFVSRRLGTDR